MATSEDYRELGIVGYTYKSSYSSETTYNRYNCVEYEGSTYVALKDGLTGVAPSNDETNWKYLARGFQKEDAKHITIIDKDNYVGSGAGTEVAMQDWADKVADDLKNADSNIFTLQSDVKENESTISAETTRATNAESELSEDISGINAKLGTDDFSALAASVSAGLKILQTFKGATDISSLSIPTASEMIKLLQGVGEAAKIGAAGFHNCIYRGKYLGSSITAAKWAAIKAGTFDDLYIGDYWTIGGVNYRIAGFDYFYGVGDTQCTVHHIVLVPDTNLYSQKFEETNTTANGYYGSVMKQSGLDAALTTVAAAFGSEHILEHREYFCNACNTSTGRPSAGAWYSTKIDIQTEEMVYGTREFAAVNPGQTDIWGGFHNYNVAYSQLPLYALDKSRICNRAWYWLRNPVSPATFAGVDGNGYADSSAASSARGVRPCFAIYQA